MSTVNSPDPDPQRGTCVRTPGEHPPLRVVYPAQETSSHISLFASSKTPNKMHIIYYKNYLASKGNAEKAKGVECPAYNPPPILMTLDHVISSKWPSIFYLSSR